MFCAALCVWFRGVPTRRRWPILFSTKKDWCELVGHAFNPTKMHKPTMQNMMELYNVTNAGELTVVMVEEVQTNYLLDPAELLHTMLTRSSYVDCVEFMF